MRPPWSVRFRLAMTRTSRRRLTKRRACVRHTTERSWHVGRHRSAGRLTQTPAALEVLHQWATGASWEEFDLSGKNTITVSHDIRTYYEEAAMGLVTGSTPGGRAAEAWFFEGTEAGRTIMAARTALKDQEAPFPFWFYMTPAHR